MRFPKQIYHSTKNNYPDSVGSLTAAAILGSRHAMQNSTDNALAMPHPLLLLSRHKENEANGLSDEARNF